MNLLSLSFFGFLLFVLSAWSLEAILVFGGWQKFPHSIETSATYSFVIFVQVLRKPWFLKKVKLSKPLKCQFFFLTGGSIYISPPNKIAELVFISLLVEF